MSIVLAVEKAGTVAVAWDTVSTWGSTRCVNMVGPAKVLQVGSSYVGCTGYDVYRNLLRDHLITVDSVDLKDEGAVFRFFMQFWHDLRERYHFVNDQSDAEDPSPFADLGAEFLVANPAGIFRVKEIMNVSRFAKFCAIGSGAPHAEGALQVLYKGSMSARDIAQAAARAALDFDAASAGSVEVVELGG